MYKSYDTIVEQLQNQVNELQKMILSKRVGYWCDFSDIGCPYHSLCKGCSAYKAIRDCVWRIEKARRMKIKTQNSQNINKTQKFIDKNFDILDAIVIFVIGIGSGAILVLTFL